MAAKEAKSERLYKNSPKLERDNESGDVGVTRPSDAESANVGEDGDSAEMGTTPEATPDTSQAMERQEVHHKHVHEKLSMSKRHEMEHASGKADNKKHVAEHKEMLDRHAAEFESMTKRHGKTSSKE